MQRLLGLLIAVSSVILFSSPASASCLMAAGQNERLANFCLLESITGRLVDERTAILVTQRLKQEGYFGGLNTPRVSSSAYPTMFYSSNVNGGNPDKNLVLGELEFEGDPSLVAEEGIILGANFGASIRNTYGEGRYFDGSLAAAVNWSAKHGTSYTTGRLAGCSRNQIKRAGYADICFDINEQKKDISSDRSKSIAFNFGHLDFAEQVGFMDFTVGLKRTFTANYQQNQASLQVQTIHRSNLLSSLKVRVGKRVPDELALRYGVDLRLTKTVAGKLLTVAVAHEYNDGGKLLGVDRNDRVNRISASMPLNRKVSVNAGYQETRSSIPYFTSQEPSISLTLTW